MRVQTERCNEYGRTAGGRGEGCWASCVRTLSPPWARGTRRSHSADRWHPQLLAGHSSNHQPTRASPTHPPAPQPAVARRSPSRQLQRTPTNSTVSPRHCQCSDEFRGVSAQLASPLASPCFSIGPPPRSRPWQYPRLPDAATPRKTRIRFRWMAATVVPSYRRRRAARGETSAARCRQRSPRQQSSGCAPPSQERSCRHPRRHVAFRVNDWQSGARVRAPSGIKVERIAARCRRRLPCAAFAGASPARGW